MSATYRQSSDLGDALAAEDPENIHYARGPRWRMTAEMVRDHALAVSGLLEGTIGGQSVTPYQPAGIWNPLNSFYEYPDAAAVPADEHHRRTMYTFVKRNALHPALKIFDFMNRTTSVSRRRTSNTPLQALTLMNDPQYVEAYRALAGVVLQQAGSAAADDEQGADEQGADEPAADEAADEPAGRARAQLRRLYRLATRTTPSAAMLDRLASFYADQRATLAADPGKARSLLAVGVTQPDANLDPVELAAMTNVAALVMNSPDAYMVR